MHKLRASLLVVDDQAPIRACLSELLTEHGYVVRLAPDGFSALAEIRKEIPDLILSDLNMPGMSGFELLSVVRRRFPSIRVIAMSGAFTAAEPPLNIAADAFYEKGTHPDFLLQMVGEIIRPRQSLLVDPPRQLAPLWIASNGHNSSGELYVTITCPECLRTFPQVLDTSDSPTLEAACIYCCNLIHYAIVHSAALLLPQN
jgi:CheY-like chemotaxis protein